MERTCLIAGKSGALLTDVVRHCSEARRQPLVARSGQAELPDLPPGSPAPISWNRRSALSARSLLLHAQTTCGRIEEAIVIYSPVHESNPFHASTVVSIEDRVDAEVKGYLFLLRELVALFESQRSGRLVLAVSDRSAELPSPLEAAGLGSFMALSRSLQDLYEGESLRVRLCYSTADDTDAFARVVAGELDVRDRRRSKSGWLTFPPRSRVRSVLS
jgi:hypothetical protein